MPMPSVEPSPLPSALDRLAVPDEAHDASYLAASAKISSFSRTSSWAIGSIYVQGGPKSSRDDAMVRPCHACGGAFSCYIIS